jgi:predicted nucleotidyltransferase
MNWEEWLRNSKSPPSNTEDDKRGRTERQIRDALRAYRPLNGRDYAVYAKGSYANNTNVRLNYDVDIAVEYRGFFYFDLEFDLKGHEPSSVDIVAPSKDPYTRDEFKGDIRAALDAAFGPSAIEPGRIAFRVREKKTTLPADVVPCWEYRRYDRICSGKPVYHTGSRIYPSGGNQAENYPAQQLENGKAKNVRTGGRYKDMVRAFKRLQTRMVDEGILEEELPSYLTECLVYNVPDSDFGNSRYRDDMRAVLASIFNATLLNGDWNDWEEVNGLKYLFRGNKAWTRQQAHTIADAAWDYMEFD